LFRDGATERKDRTAKLFPGKKDSTKGPANVVSEMPRAQGSKRSISGPICLLNLMGTKDAHQPTNGTLTDPGQKGGPGHLATEYEGGKDQPPGQHLNKKNCSETFEKKRLLVEKQGEKKVAPLSTRLVKAKGYEECKEKNAERPFSRMTGLYARGTRGKRQPYR